MSSVSTKSHNQEILKQLKPGDLVKFYRTFYVHWGVYEGNGHIIHVTGSFIEELLKHKAKVKREDFYTVAEGNKAYIANENDERWLPLTEKEIVRRAKASIGVFYYDFIYRNSEHFAIWCRYGTPTSEQVEEYYQFTAEEMTVKSAETKLLVTVEKSSGMGMWNDKNNEHNKTVLKTLKPGDLVKFSRRHYTDWGVYEGNGLVIHVTVLFMDCVLKYNAEVKRGDFFAVANGDRADNGNEMDKIWKPLDADEIVQRARRSIGQLIHCLFYNNTSEHFAKWCRYDINVGNVDAKFQFNEEDLKVLSVELNQMQTVKSNARPNCT